MKHTKKHTDAGHNITSTAPKCEACKGSGMTGRREACGHCGGLMSYCGDVSSIVMRGSGRYCPGGKLVSPGDGRLGTFWYCNTCRVRVDPNTGRVMHGWPPLPVTEDECNE